MLGAPDYKYPVDNPDKGNSFLRIDMLYIENLDSSSIAALSASGAHDFSDQREDNNKQDKS